MKVIDKLKVRLADDTVQEWDRVEDGISGASVAEGNVLIVMDKDNHPIFMYAPMFWLTVETEYGITDDKPEDKKPPARPGQPGRPPLFRRDSSA